MPPRAECSYGVHAAASRLRLLPLPPFEGSLSLDSDANICSRVTSDGSPYARFRRALDTGNELLVLTAARELPQIALADALRICLVLRDGDRERYERAAVRWPGRFALEARGVTIDALRYAGDALDALPDRTPEAMEQLQRLC